MMLQSGKVPPEQVGQFQFFVGNLAYAEQDWAAARTALQAAIAAGYTQDDPEGLIAETYFSEGQAAQGLTFLRDVVDRRAAAGQNVPENWLLRGLRVAYEGNLPDQATEFSAQLVSQYPTERNWLQSLQVVDAMNSLEPQAQLDLLRLMMTTGALTERREFVNYIEAADVRVMSNEVLRVLQRGIEAGVFAADDTYYSPPTKPTLPVLQKRRAVRPAALPPRARATCFSHWPTGRRLKPCSSWRWRRAGWTATVC
jgi:hypothetical protein